jgi:hypothetical protein
MAKTVAHPLGTLATRDHFTYNNILYQAGGGGEAVCR